ncbi:hypothetical protein [Pseudomonas sp. GM80]|uniref:hypothetical protein n=1 Tax=Pseudomonas sp. GM80 TaxID=1144339 RepID=UPI00026FBF91|nr:hypothetical protein [Pseudomonas sp. GM80]EJN34288.1 hypothetical protein PMI37_01148 [Pseudomonas sp. GM80]
MKMPKQFPISQRDIDRGRFARSAKSLSNMANRPMPIGVAERAIANLLGYSDLDEMERTANCFPEREFNPNWKQEICVHVMYRVHKNLRIPLDHCSHFFVMLGLMEYSFMKRDYPIMDRTVRTNFDFNGESGADKLRKFPIIQSRRLPDKVTTYRAAARRSS